MMITTGLFSLFFSHTHCTAGFQSPLGDGLGAFAPCVGSKVKSGICWGGQRPKNKQASNADGCTSHTHTFTRPMGFRKCFKYRWAVIALLTWSNRKQIKTGPQNHLDNIYQIYTENRKSTSVCRSDGIINTLRLISSHCTHFLALLSRFAIPLNRSETKTPTRVCGLIWVTRKT